MKYSLIVMTAVIVIFSMGCADIEDTIIINDDGSAILERSMSVAKGQMPSYAGMYMPQQQEPFIIPLDKMSFEKCDFGKGISVLSSSFRQKDEGGMDVKLKVKIADVFNIPDKAINLIQFDVKRGKDNVHTFRTFTGTSQWYMFEHDPDGSFKRLKALAKKGSYSVKVTFPGEVRSVRGMEQKEKTVSWKWEASKLKPAEFKDENGTFAIPEVVFQCEMKNTPAEPAGKGNLKLVSLNLSLSKSIEYGSDLEVNNTRYSMSTSVSFAIPEEIKDPVYDNVTIEKAETDTGESLVEKQRNMSFGMDRRGGMFGRTGTLFGRKRPSFHVYLRLKAPGADAKKITVIKGTLDFKIPADTEVIKIDRLGDAMGMPKTVETSTGDTFTYSFEEGKVTIKMGEDLYNLKDRIVIRDPNGKEFRSGGSSMSGMNGKYTLERTGEYTAECSMELHFVLSENTKTYTFEMRDIALE